MSNRWRFFAAILVVAAALPELPRYQAERDLAEAGRQIDHVMRGDVKGLDAVNAAQQAEAKSQSASRWLPGDARPPLHRAVALMLLARTNEAIAVLESAIRVGERPELTLNLGRARFQRGDRQGANRAYLRAAWAAPAVLKTLPRPMRTALLNDVALLEVELRDGRSTLPPALD
jgi:tetratricopeptide (TPR) repeat protein